MRKVSRVVVPSSMQAEGERREARPSPAGSAAYPASTASATLTIGVACRSSRITVRPLDSVVRCTAGNVHVGRVAERRQHLAIERGLARRERGYGCHGHRVVRSVEPSRRGGPDLLPASPWPSCSSCVQVRVGVAAERQALGQHVGTAAEAAQPLDAADEVGEPRGCARAAVPPAVGPVARNVAEHRVDLALGRRRIDARS